MNKPYIVFDLDDTLFYEQDFLTSAYREIADFVSKNHVESVHQKMLELYRQKQDTFAYVAAQYNVSKDDLITMYRSHFPSVSLRAGVLGILENLAMLIMLRTSIFIWCIRLKTQKETIFMQIQN